jgi:hypothetical protein
MSSGLKDSQLYCQLDLNPKYGELFSTLFLEIFFLFDCEIVEYSHRDWTFAVEGSKAQSSNSSTAGSND